jgi:hypothetical protein
MPKKARKPRKPQRSAPEKSVVTPRPPAEQSSEPLFRQTIVGPRADEPGYVDPSDVREWITEFEVVHRHLPHQPARRDGPALGAPQVPAASMPGISQLADIIERLENAMGWLSAASTYTSKDAGDPGALFDTTELHRSVCNLFDHLQAHVMLLEAAVGVVARNEPLAATLRNGSRWGGKLPPAQVTRLAEEAAYASETLPYLAGRANQTLAEATGFACDGGEKRKTCGGTRVRLANGTRATSCWPHLSREAKEQIRAEREAALAAPCSFCHARAGETCVDLDGAETTIHNHRLRPDAVRTSTSLRPH